MTSRVPLLRTLAASLVSALTVAALTHAATVLVFFVSNGSTADSLGLLSDYFLSSSVLLFALMTVAGLARAYWRWYTALGASIVASIIAALVGTLVSYLSSGNAFTSDILPSLFATLGTTSLIFVVAGIVSTMVFGRRVYTAVLAWRSSQTDQGRVLVRLPSSTLADGELTHLERTDVDVELADTQWEQYVAALEAEGFTPVEVAAADEHPDAVFIEDAVVMLGRVAVLTSPGAESRRGEIASVEAAVTDLGLTIKRIEEPGTLEGGDVLKVGTTVYVGRGGRTNAEGIRQFRSIASELGFLVVAVPVSRVLHLKSAVTALPDGTVIGHPDLVEHPELFDRFLAVPEASGAAVVVLSPTSVLMAASAPETALLLEDLGYRVVTVDISEFEKMEGCVTCLSVRVR
jgi:dimethylargininase